MKKSFILLLCVGMELSCYPISLDQWEQWVLDFQKAEKDFNLEEARKNQILLEGAYYYTRKNFTNLTVVEQHLSGVGVLHLSSYIQNLPAGVHTLSNRNHAGIVPTIKEQQRLERDKNYKKKYTGATYTTTLQDIEKNMGSFSSTVGKDNNRAGELFGLIEKSYDEAFAFYKFISHEVQVHDEKEAINQFEHYGITLKSGETPRSWLENQFTELIKLAELINDAGKTLSRAHDKSGLQSIALLPNKAGKEVDEKKASTVNDRMKTKEGVEKDGKAVAQQKLTQAAINSFIEKFKQLHHAIQSKNVEEALLAFSAVEFFYDTFKDAYFERFDTKDMPKIDTVIIDQLRIQVAGLNSDIKK